MRPDEGAIARRYARAALLYCDSHGGHEVFAGGLSTMAEAFKASSLFRSLLTSPLLSKSKKAKLAAEVVKVLGVPAAVGRFVDVLVSKGRAEFLEAIRGRFGELLDEKMGRVRAEVLTAAEVDESMKTHIAAVLSQFFAKRVLCSFYTDETLFGGVLARVGNTVIDSSIRGKLEKVRLKIGAS